MINEKNFDSSNTYIEINTVSSEEKQDSTFKDTIEIREKRIGIVFKVIYVFAIFLGAVFVDMDKRISAELDMFYICESCIFVFLFVMIFRMVFYIIDEMKCMKINPSDVSNELIENTEKSYSEIFSSLWFVAFATFLGWIIVCFARTYITEQILTYLLVGLPFLSPLVFLLTIKFKEKRAINNIRKFFLYISIVFYLIVIFVLAAVINK